MKATIDFNRQDYDEKMKKQNYKLDKISAMVENITDQIQISNHSPENMDSPKVQDLTTLVPDKKKAPHLEGGHSTKIGGM